MPRITASFAQPAQDTLARESNYFITVSTNRRPASDAEADALKDDLGDAAYRIFTDEASIAQFITFNKPFHNMTFIDSFHTDIVSEVGTDKRGGRVHSHIEFNVSHHSNISLKIPHAPQVLRKLFLAAPELQKYNLSNVYINIRLRHNDLQAIRVYKAKQLKKGRPRRAPPATPAPAAPLPQRSFSINSILNP